MNRLTLMACVFLPTFIASEVWAASMIESQQEEGIQQMYVDGSRMLIRDPSGDGFMLMDIANMKSYAVNHGNKTAIDMSETLFGAVKAGKAVAPPKVDARLEKVGDGPEIAGYATTHYVLYANGYKCSDMWTSVKALKDSGWDELWSSHGKAMMALGMEADPHPCDAANDQAFRPNEHGMPLKEVDRNCESDLVRRIERNAEIDRAAFEVPEGYKIIKMPMMPSATASTGPSMWTGWNGQDDCSDMGGYDDEEYLDEEYAEEEYLDEDYVEEEYMGDELPGDGADDVPDEASEGLEDKVSSKLKGFMNKLKKKDKDG